MALPLRESNETPTLSWVGEAKSDPMMCIMKEEGALAKGEENAFDFAVIVAHELLATEIIFVEIETVVVLVESVTGSIFVGTESIIDMVVSLTEYVSVETERIALWVDVEGTQRAPLMIHPVRWVCLDLIGFDGPTMVHRDRFAVLGPLGAPSGLSGE
jgi:hypothetical protein